MHTNTELTIRPAIEADVPAILDIYTAEVLTGTATFEIEPPSADEMARRLAVITANGGPYLVAERAGGIAGYAYAGPFHTRAAFRHTLESSVYIARDAARAGLGRALMEELIARCSAAEFHTLVAVVGGENAASLALHASLGFTKAGRLDEVGFKFGHWLPITYMILALPAATQK